MKNTRWSKQRTSKGNAANNGSPNTAKRIKNQGKLRAKITSNSCSGSDSSNGNKAPIRGLKRSKTVFKFTNKNNQQLNKTKLSKLKRSTINSFLAINKLQKLNNVQEIASRDQIKLPSGLIDSKIVRFVPYINMGNLRNNKLEIISSNRSLRRKKTVATIEISDTESEEINDDRANIQYNEFEISSSNRSLRRKKTDKSIKTTEEIKDDNSSTHLSENFVNRRKRKVSISTVINSSSDEENHHKKRGDKKSTINKKKVVKLDQKNSPGKKGNGKGILNRSREAQHQGSETLSPKKRKFENNSSDSAEDISLSNTSIVSTKVKKRVSFQLDLPHSTPVVTKAAKKLMYSPKDSHDDSSSESSDDDDDGKNDEDYSGENDKNHGSENGDDASEQSTDECEISDPPAGLKTRKKKLVPRTSVSLDEAKNKIKNLTSKNDDNSSSENEDNESERQSSDETETINPPAGMKTKKKKFRHIVSVSSDDSSSETGDLKNNCMDRTSKNEDIESEGQVTDEAETSDSPADEEYILSAYSKKILMKEKDVRMKVRGEADSDIKIKKRGLPFKFRFTNKFHYTEHCCDICRKIFSRNVNLQCHMLRHLQPKKLYIDLYKYHLPDQFLAKNQEDKYLKPRGAKLPTTAELKSIVGKYSVEAASSLESTDTSVHENNDDSPLIEGTSPVSKVENITTKSSSLDFSDAHDKMRPQGNCDELPSIHSDPNEAPTTLVEQLENEDTNNDSQSGDTNSDPFIDESSPISKVEKSVADPETKEACSDTSDPKVSNSSNESEETKVLSIHSDSEEILETPGEHSENTATTENENDNTQSQDDNSFRSNYETSPDSSTKAVYASSSDLSLSDGAIETCSSLDASEAIRSKSKETNVEKQTEESEGSEQNVKLHFENGNCKNDKIALEKYGKLQCKEHEDNPEPSDIASQSGNAEIKCTNDDDNSEDSVEKIIQVRNTDINGIRNEVCDENVTRELNDEPNKESREAVTQESTDEIENTDTNQVMLESQIERNRIILESPPHDNSIFEVDTDELPESEHGSNLSLTTLEPSATEISNNEHSQCNHDKDSSFEQREEVKNNLTTEDIDSEEDFVLIDENAEAINEADEYENKCISPASPKHCDNLSDDLGEVESDLEKMCFEEKCQTNTTAEQMKTVKLSDNSSDEYHSLSNDGIEENITKQNEFDQIHNDKLVSKSGTVYEDLCCPPDTTSKSVTKSVITNQDLFNILAVDTPNAKKVRFTSEDIERDVQDKSNNGNTRDSET